MKLSDNNYYKSYNATMVTLHWLKWKALRFFYRQRAYVLSQDLSIRKGVLH